MRRSSGLLLLRRAGAADGTVDERLRRVKGDVADGLVIAGAAGWPCAARVADRVDGMERQVLALVLDPGRGRGVEQATRDGDHAAGEEALVELPVGAVDGDSGVAADAPAGAHGQRGGEGGLVDGLADALGRRVDRRRRAGARG
jgi:hypothetical protein